MRALFFGSEQQPLYGVHHPPRRSAANGDAVVLCYPIGHEYPNAHRSFRLLATQLARAGLHVLRFDYGGTGDSSGEVWESGVRRWLGDVGLAVTELRSIASPERVSLVGLRLGAALAAVRAAGDDSLHRVVLWDPVIDTPSYHEALLELADPPYTGLADQGAPSLMGVAGYPLSPTICSEIEAMEVADAIRSGAHRIHVVTTPLAESDPGWTEVSNADFASVESSDGGRDWLRPHQPGIVPQSQLAAIVQCLKGS